VVTRPWRRKLVSPWPFHSTGNRQRTTPQAPYGLGAQTIFVESMLIGRHP